MKRKLKLLILAHDQFGYSITKYKHCEYAQDHFDITYIGWDYGQPKIELPKIKVIYVDRKSNVIVRNLRLLYTFHKHVNGNYDVVFANYVRGISLVKLLNFRKEFILYIDTLGIMPNKIKRWAFDFILSIESRFFKNIALISSGISKKISIKKFDVLPLGGHCFTTKSKTFERLSLLYVGTLSNRNIIDCVRGFHAYIKTLGNIDTMKPTFTIIGDSSFGHLKEIRNYVRKHNLESYFRIPGYIHSNKLASFFEEANIGVSYVPIQPYFQNQPPTKTFEYLISGLPTIATATEANKEIVSSGVSELIADNPESFCNALIKIYKRKNDFDSDRIRAQYERFTWENIVRQKFVPLVERVSKL